MGQILWILLREEESPEDHSDGSTRLLSPALLSRSETPVTTWVPPFPMRK